MGPPAYIVHNDRGEPMKESTQFRILAIVVLVVFAFIDALPFTAVTAFALIVLILFRPKWFRKIIDKLYE